MALRRKIKKKNSPAPGFQEPSLGLQIVNRYIWWIIVLIVLVIAFVSYSLFISGQIEAVRSAASDNLPQKQDSLDKLKAVKKDLDQTIIDFDRIKNAKKDELDKLRALLPTRDQYGDLFAIVDQITAGSGLQLQTMSIAFSGDAAPVEAVQNLNPETTIDVAAANAAAAPGAGIQTMTVNMSVTGGDYAAFKRYLETLERSVRLFDVKSLSFDGASVAGTAVAEDGVSAGGQYTIELVTYYQG